MKEPNLRIILLSSPVVVGAPPSSIILSVFSVDPSALGVFLLKFILENLTGDFDDIVGDFFRLSPSPPVCDPEPLPLNS